MIIQLGIKVSFHEEFWLFRLSAVITVLTRVIERTEHVDHRKRHVTHDDGKETLVALK